MEPEDGTEPTEPTTELPQPPRPAVVERKKITLTDARRLSKRAESLLARYDALVDDLDGLGVRGADSGLRGELGDALSELENSSIGQATGTIVSVADKLEDILG